MDELTEVEGGGAGRGDGLRLGSRGELVTAGAGIGDGGGAGRGDGVGGGRREVQARVGDGREACQVYLQ